MPPGLELGDEERRLTVAVLGHSRRPTGLVNSANHSGRERQRDPKTDPGKGVGERPRQTKNGGDPRRGGAGLPDEGNKARPVTEAEGRVGAGLGWESPTLEANGIEALSQRLTVLT